MCSVYHIYLVNDKRVPFLRIFTFFSSHAIFIPMKVLITLLKPLSFLPAIVMMYLIFSFSAQTGEVSGELSYQISYKIVETENQLLSQGKTSLLCKKSRTHDRIFSSGHCSFISFLCISHQGILALSACRYHLCRFCMSG